ILANRQPRNCLGPSGASGGSKSTTQRDELESIRGGRAVCATAADGPGVPQEAVARRTRVGPPGHIRRIRDERRTWRYLDCFEAAIDDGRDSKCRRHGYQESCNDEAYQ